MNQKPPSLLSRITNGSLVLQIIFGMLAGVALASLAPEATKSVTFLGGLFVKVLKAVAPILVFVLVASSIANKKQGVKSNMRPVLMLYVLGTFLAAVVGVAASFMFPTKLVLVNAAAQNAAPGAIGEVLHALIFQIADNPINALATGNYIGILAWAVALGMSLHYAGEVTKQVIADLADGVSSIVQKVIRLAPIGVFGIVADTIGTTGFSALLGYSQLILVLVGSMLVVALVVNPLIVFLTIRRNPFPLVFTCLRESGVTAFFTRSSAANIPVNLQLCKKLGLHEDTYSVSIPLGATINMAGAAITITVMSLAAVHTLGIQVDMPTALLLSIISTIGACGASGVAGGSLLLIPLACSLFGISGDIAMQVVAVGFLIGVIQDSSETALNSSTDVLFTAAACIAAGDVEQPVAQSVPNQA